MHKQLNDSSGIKLHVGPLPVGMKMQAEECIEAMERLLEAEETTIEERWQQLRAEIAVARSRRRGRGRPRKHYAP